MSKEKAPRYVDAHVHIWSSDIKRYGLGKGFKSDDMKPIAYLADDILHDARPSGVDRVVLVQMNVYGFDNSYMLDAIKLRPDIFRGIAVVDGTSEACDVVMCRLSELGVRGFRLYPEEVTPSNLDEPGFRRMFHCGAEKRLAICLLMNPDSLGAVDRQCQEFPHTPVVIDHLARIGFGGSIRESDIKALCALAKHPQVRVKLSGFYALGLAEPPYLDLAPLIKRVYEAFGPKRLMWGSDCPFQVTHATYEDAISLIRDRLDFISNEHKEWILGTTADELFFN
ncbi:MAG: amidohydrolase family protein [Candidatus Sulfotelmatobacter sp.]|jgi:predicted TIM-barrel fold metal-dependent hydrolase